MNLYCILGIAPDAGEEAIRAAYRSLARRYHPDAGPGSSSEKFREVTEAYETLADPARRLSYDRSLERSSSIILPAGPEIEPMIQAEFEPETEPMIVRAEPLSGHRPPLNLRPYPYSMHEDLLRWLLDDAGLFDWPRRW
jgi:curved DNA-binding protein CbpA